MDFPHDRKDDVVRSFSTSMAASIAPWLAGSRRSRRRSAFAEVAKVLGVAERDVRKFTEHFPGDSAAGGCPTNLPPGRG